MSTKRSPAQSPAKKKPEQQPRAADGAVATVPFHPLRADVGDTRYPAPYFQPEDMTRTHELIVDAVTQMITAGGHRDDVDGLIYSAMAHTRRRTFESFGDDEAHSSEMVAKFIKTDFEDWRQDLVSFWRKNKRPDAPPAIEPKDITDRIRANVRETLIGMFGEFMGMASPEEQRFLLEVFHNNSGRSHAGEVGSHEIFIANAFEVELGRDRCYIRVPEHMVPQVQKYVDALRAIDDKEVA